MPQILCVACFKGVFQLDGSNALLVILISDYDLLLEKTIGWFFFCNSDISLKSADGSNLLRNFIPNFWALRFFISMLRLK